MKHTIFLFSLFVFLTSCLNSNKNHNSLISNIIDSSSLLKPNYEKQFKEWLNTHNLTTTNFVDSTTDKTCDLWAYSHPLSKTDSLRIWTPSKDSSCFLITNYDKTGNKRLGKNKDIEFGFFDRKNKKVYLGICILDSTSARKIDYYWYDSNTFYFLEKFKSNEFQLTKLIIKTEKMWTFNTKINK